jgi:hypothetical protein
LFFCFFCFFFVCFVCCSWLKERSIHPSSSCVPISPSLFVLICINTSEIGSSPNFPIHIELSFDLV